MGPGRGPGWGATAQRRGRDRAEAPDPRIDTRVIPALINKQSMRIVGNIRFSITGARRIRGGPRVKTRVIIDIIGVKLRFIVGFIRYEILGFSILGPQREHRC